MGNKIRTKRTGRHSAKSRFLALFIAVFGVFSLFTACEEPISINEVTNMITELELSKFIVAPVAGEKPAKVISNIKQYTGDIEWRKTGEEETIGAGELFEASTDYTAEVRLTAKDGYTFTGISANRFTYDGTAVNHAAGSGKTMTATIEFPAAGAGASVKLTNTSQIVPYLNGKNEGTSAGNPIPLALELQLNEANWNVILNAIHTAGKFVAVDLSACTRSGSSSGGGLSGGGDFDPMNTTNTGKDKIVDLTLPTVATGIAGGDYGNAAFKHFTALKTVSGAGITSIGGYAFAGCAALTSVSFPKAAFIGGSAFYNCGALTSVSFPKAAAIGGSAFYNCGALTSVSFPKAASIDDRAFSSCDALISVNFPELTVIGTEAFSSCYALTSVTLGATPPTLGVNILKNISARTVTVRIPESAKAAYGVPGLPGTNFDNGSTVDSWGRAFKGVGWSGTNYGSGPVNANITLRFETHTQEAPEEPLGKITDPSQIVPYLNAQIDEASASNPLLPAMELEMMELEMKVEVQLTEANWLAVLNAINIAGKLVDLDLSACTKSTASTGGGLRSGGDFDPMSTSSTGKDKIVNVTLPTLATGIVAGTTTNAAFKNFTALKTVSGAEVTSIGVYAFRACGALISVSFPKAASIGDGAFYQCAALTSVSVPKAAAIGYRVFYQCGALTSVDFPAAATIGEQAFAGCAVLTIVNFPKAAAIGNYAFEGCDKLTIVNFPKAAAIGNYAFESCDKLDSVNFPELTAIGNEAFSSCNVLSSVTLGATPPTLGTRILYNINARTVTVRIPESAKAAYGVPNLNFDNSSSTNSWGRAFKGTGWSGTSYGSGAVNNNITLRFSTDTPEAPEEPGISGKLTNPNQIVPYLNGKTGGTSTGNPISLVMELQLTEANWIAILNGIKTAGKFVGLDLAACTPSSSSSGGGLHSIGDFDPMSTTSTGKAKIVNLTLPTAATGIVAGTITNAAFKNFTAFKTVSGAGVTSIGGYAFAGCGVLTSVSFPEAATIGSYAFFGCAALTSASFPKAATIGSYAFYNCAALTSASFPKAAAIGSDAFYNCSALTSASFPEAASIGDRAFYNCSALTSASFPKAATIGERAFSGCSALTSASFPKATTIGDAAFNNCSALTSVSFPEAASIGKGAFSGCSALTSVSFPKAAAIGSDAFSGCAALTSVSFPKAAAIGRYAFSGCAALTSASFPEAAAIGSYAFYNCYALTSASFPKAAAIGSYAFRNCYALTSVSFPKAATIGNSAFSGCSALTSASFPEATEIGGATADVDFFLVDSNVFSGCGALTSVSFPKAAVIRSKAFSGCGALTTVTLGATPPTMGTRILYNISARTVTVRIPASAKAAYGVPGLPGTNFNNSSTANSWGNAFKGTGWVGTDYLNGAVNANITLSFETY